MQEVQEDGGKRSKRKEKQKLVKAQMETKTKATVKEAIEKLPDEDNLCAGSNTTQDDLVDEGKQYAEQEPGANADTEQAEGTEGAPAELQQQAARCVLLSRARWMHLYLINQ
jgi:hypothetical protein